MRPFSFDPIVDNLGYSLTFDKHQLAELLAVRKQLEAGFVEEVAARATPAQLRVLRSVVDRMGERVALETQTTDFQEEDRFFHRTLYGGLGNELLLKLLDVFWTVYRPAARPGARRGGRPGAYLGGPPAHRRGARAPRPGRRARGHHQALRRCGGASRGGAARSGARAGDQSAESVGR